MSARHRNDVPLDPPGSTHRQWIMPLCQWAYEIRNLKRIFGNLYFVIFIILDVYYIERFDGWIRLESWEHEEVSILHDGIQHARSEIGRWARAYAPAKLLEVVRVAELDGLEIVIVENTGGSEGSGPTILKISRIDRQDAASLRDSHRDPVDFEACVLRTTFEHFKQGLGVVRNILKQVDTLLGTEEQLTPCEVAILRVVRKFDDRKLTKSYITSFFNRFIEDKNFRAEHPDIYYEGICSSSTVRNYLSVLAEKRYLLSGQGRGRGSQGYRLTEMATEWLDDHSG